jgi:LysR family hca operon transcriptional activator
VPGIEVTISSLSSLELARALKQNRTDVALLRRESQTSGLAFRLLAKQPLVVILPANHRLAEKETITPQEPAHETFIAGSTRLAPVLKATVKNMLRDSE